MPQIEANPSLAQQRADAERVAAHLVKLAALVRKHPMATTAGAVFERENHFVEVDDDGRCTRREWSGRSTFRVEVTLNLNEQFDQDA